MTVLHTIGDLFEEEPRQWGLRGDPHLWRDMRAHLIDTALPASESELEGCIKAAFETLTGRRFDQNKPFGDARYAHGGMSSGMISPEFWQGPGICLLKDRYRGRADR